MIESKKELKSLLMRVKGGKAGLKLAFFLKKKRKKVMASGPIISWQIEGGKVETAFLSSKITVDADCSQKFLPKI